MELTTFQSLPVTEVAQLVRASGKKVGVFPVNGTRRWYMLERNIQYAELAGHEIDYIDTVCRRCIEIFQMFFEHGVDTLLVPLFGPAVEERGEHYLRIMEQGILYWTTNAHALDFYKASETCVRLYGDVRRYVDVKKYGAGLEAFDELSRQTAAHQCNRLFLGAYAHDATQAVVDISVDYYRQHGRSPSRREVVESYYGDYVDPVSFFIGYTPLAAFDMPLVALGREDLYFTVAPSLYLDEKTLRTILYDHLYMRGEPDYACITTPEWDAMRQFYRYNYASIIGLGKRNKAGGIWYPLAGVAPVMDACTSENG